jgi:hypothetical protein
VQALRLKTSGIKSPEGAKLKFNPKHIAHRNLPDTFSKMICIHPEKSFFYDVHAGFQCNL